MVITVNFDCTPGHMRFYKFCRQGLRYAAKIIDIRHPLSSYLHCEMEAWPPATQELAIESYSFLKVQHRQRIAI